MRCSRRALEVVAAAAAAADVVLVVVAAAAAVVLVLAAVVVLARPHFVVLGGPGVSAGLRSPPSGAGRQVPKPTPRGPKEAPRWLNPADGPKRAPRQSLDSPRWAPSQGRKSSRRASRAPSGGPEATQAPGQDPRGPTDARGWARRGGATTTPKRAPRRAPFASQAPTAAPTPAPTAGYHEFQGYCVTSEGGTGGAAPSGVCSTSTNFGPGVSGIDECEEVCNHAPWCVAFQYRLTGVADRHCTLVTGDADPGQVCPAGWNTGGDFDSFAGSDAIFGNGHGWYVCRVKVTPPTASPTPAPTTVDAY